MFSSRLLRCSITKDVTKTVGGKAAVLSPSVIRSLYRGLYREVHHLDKDTIAKTLFPCPKELQDAVGGLPTLYVPNSSTYVDLLRRVFRDTSKPPQLSLAFSTLNRLRAHRQNTQEKLPAIYKDREQFLSSLQKQTPLQKKLYRAELIPSVTTTSPRYVPTSTAVPTRVVLRNTQGVELTEGTVLVAHPLSSTHIDRRVMIITEKTSLLTTAIVLDLQFSYPLSRGNPMFPEVFWGHEVLDGGYSQIGFTMPPTAQITILHTLEPPTEENEPQYMRWLKWREEQPKGTGTANPRKQHLCFCKPLIEGQVLDDGTREPTLYISKMDAIPYLSTIAPGQPRSSLRVYWGCMRWTTAQIEAEVANGHWMALKVSPSFYRAYTVVPEDEDCFPTAEELRETREMRVRRYGADISVPQSFPPDQILRRRECLWDEMLYALGGEFTALVGCSNPFSGYSDRANPHILSALPPAPTPVALPDGQSLEEDFDLEQMGTGSSIREKSASWGRSAGKGKAGEKEPTATEQKGLRADAVETEKTTEEEEKDKDKTKSNDNEPKKE